MKKLHIADDLSLPVDAATQTFAFIARKGGGKTYAAGKLVELLMIAGVQVVVMDTVGNWYGLRLSADGRSRGFDIPVLGGLRGDIDLEARGGELIADIVADTGRSLVLDVSQFSMTDRKRFAVAFGERLWRRKKGEHHPTPLHLVIEESQLIVPQFTGKTGGDDARMLGVYEEIIRLGRNYGIGVTMISQRPQSVNKEVLNQTECLFVGQVNGSQERDALKKWITHQGMDVGLVDELPSLAVGTMYVWSPQWLRILRKVRIGKKETFDASATPKVGENRPRRELKPLDLDDLKEKLTATIERQRAEDPRELKKQIADLKRQLDAKPAVSRSEVDPAKVRELAGKLADRAVAKALRPIHTLHRKLATEFSSLSLDFAAINTEFSDLVEKAKEIEQPDLDLEEPAIRRAVEPTVEQRRPAPPTVASTRNPVPIRNRPNGDDGNQKLPIGERACLIVAAMRPDGATRTEISVQTGYKRSTRDAYIQRLREKGYVEISSENVVATDSGIDALGSDYEPLPTGSALREWWMGRLPIGEAQILGHLVKVYPDGMDRDTISDLTGFKRSTRDAYLKRLSTKRLVVGDRGPVAASRILFN